ncbi:MTR1 [Symbiodinium sp. CCMP2592]|nr:MTR1 [Symbiodinium sp. CCMP2592]
MRRFVFLLCYAVGGRSVSRSYSGGTVDMSGILRWEADEVGALCDESILPKINCENNLWQQLLTLLCRHCSRNRCAAWRKQQEDGVFQQPANCKCFAPTPETKPPFAQSQQLV